MRDNEQPVLVDTNVIIEAHRVRSWNAITGWFAIETVEKCVCEAGSGDKRRPGYIPVDVDSLCEKVHVHRVSKNVLLMAELSNPRFMDLDPGERELLAFAKQYDKAWILCSPDLACMSVMVELGLTDRLVSLEFLQEQAGINKNLRDNFTEAFLKTHRNRFVMGLL